MLLLLTILISVKYKLQHIIHIQCKNIIIFFIIFIDVHLKYTLQYKIILYNIHYLYLISAYTHKIKLSINI